VCLWSSLRKLLRHAGHPHANRSDLDLSVLRVSAFGSYGADPSSGSVPVAMAGKLEKLRGGRRVCCVGCRLARTTAATPVAMRLASSQVHCRAACVLVPPCKASCWCDPSHRNPCSGASSSGSDAQNSVGFLWNAVSSRLRRLVMHWSMITHTVLMWFAM
jgi:hypothetical protein